jgi:hypothetical protein
MAPASSERRVRGERRSAVITRSTMMTVRRVLHAYREGWLLEERLAAAARMAAADAHRRGVSAEWMLVALEREWAALEDVRRLAVPDARELLSRLVTLCIRAYYRPGRSASRARRRTELVGDRDARSAA